MAIQLPYANPGGEKPPSLEGGGPKGRGLHSLALTPGDSLAYTTPAAFGGTPF